MQQKNENEDNVKFQKTLALEGGANIFLTVCYYFKKATEALYEGKISHLLSRPSSTDIVIWAVVNTAILWRFHEVGKNMRWPSNKWNDMKNLTQSSVSGLINFFQPKPGIPSSTQVEMEGKVRLGNMENVWKNTIEGGAGYYDAYLSPK